MVKSDNPAYKAVLLALAEDRVDDIPALMSPAKRIEKESGGIFTVKDGVVFVDGTPVTPELSEKIVEFHRENAPYKPLVAFSRRIQANPSSASVEQLFEFLVKNKHPITGDGHFIAYKKVRKHNDGHLRDAYTGTLLNDPGMTVSMPREQVDSNRSNECSRGLHVANWKYASDVYGDSSDVLLEVEVDPADVVSVPRDYNGSKMRVCKYTVRKITSEPHPMNMLVVAEYTDDEKEKAVEEAKDILKPVPFHSEASIRKMSFERKQQYKVRLEMVKASCGTSEEQRKPWQKAYSTVCRMIAEKVSPKEES